MAKSNVLRPKPLRASYEVIESPQADSQAWAIELAHKLAARNGSVLPLQARAENVRHELGPRRWHNLCHHRVRYGKDRIQLRSMGCSKRSITLIDFGPVRSARGAKS